MEDRIRTLPFPGYQARRGMLLNLKKVIKKRKWEILEALKLDLNKSHTESLVSEFLPLLFELNHTLRHLRRWMKPRPVSHPLPLTGTRSWIHTEPRGIVLVLSPWNYPFILSLYPLVSAIAAGNSVILKPSEISSHTSRIIAEVIRDAFPPGRVAVVQGDGQVAQRLLSLPFDSIFFTGGPERGKSVYRAAAENLTHLALELGGKSPAIVHSTADLKLAADRIIAGKLMNLGQTCIAPDYVLIHRDVEQKFKEILLNNLTGILGPTPEDSASRANLARMINEKHFGRVAGLLEEAKAKKTVIEWGGYTDPDSLYISPTILWNPDMDQGIMQEEIFGPLLPIIPYQTLEDAIDLINGRPVPLALYIFSEDARINDYILKSTRAGSTGVNETLQQFANPWLPFGGSGASGFGKAKGYAGFLEFSNRRSVLERRFELIRIAPPYDRVTERLINFLSRWL